MRSCAALIAVLMLPAVAQARPGDLDRSFSRDGRIVFARAVAAASVLGTAGGGITAMVGVYSSSTSLRSFDSHGRPRAGFPVTPGDDATAAGTGYAVLDHAFASPPGTPPRVIRVGVGGAIAGVAALPTPALGVWRGLLIVGDARGRVTVIGTLHPTGGDLSRPGEVLAVRFDAAGVLDERFGDRGVAKLPFGTRIAIARPRGGVLVGFDDRDGVSLLQLTAAGAPDPSFGDRGVRRFRVRPRHELDFVVLHALRSMPGGGIMAAVRWDATQKVIRLLPDGRRDARFREIDVPRRQDVTAFGRDASGRVLVAFAKRTLDFTRAHLSRYGRRGRIDRGFGDDGKAPLPPHRSDWTGTHVGTIEVDARGRIVLGGEELTDEPLSGSAGGYLSRPLIARLHG